MTKILSQSFLFFALAIVSVILAGMEAKAQELFSTNTFFEESDCRVLDGRAKRLCLLHCEFLECDDAESLGLGPFLGAIHERTCNGLLDRYEEETGFAGPNCFCDQACDLKFDDCIAECDPEDPCCPTDCRNARSGCKTSCCFQRVDVEYNLCIDDCNGDPDCEFNCTMSTCGGAFEGCFIPF